MNNMKPLTYFLGIFAFLMNAGDLITTLTALPFGATELNPLLRQVGATYFFLIKILLPTLFIILCLITAESKSKNFVLCARISLGIVGVVFLFCIINNLIVLSSFI